jgi:hypothetical protein
MYPAKAFGERFLLALLGHDIGLLHGGVQVVCGQPLLDNCRLTAILVLQLPPRKMRLRQAVPSTVFQLLDGDRGQ